jgi:hypothetical protein
MCYCYCQFHVLKFCNCFWCAISTANFTCNSFATATYVLLLLQISRCITLLLPWWVTAFANFTIYIFSCCYFYWCATATANFTLYNFATALMSYYFCQFHDLYFFLLLFLLMCYWYCKFHEIGSCHFYWCAIATANFTFINLATATNVLLLLQISRFIILQRHWCAIASAYFTFDSFATAIDVLLLLSISRFIFFLAATVVILLPPISRLKIFATATDVLLLLSI